ncbi:MAG: MBL fold metallo-hydrolase [Thermoleophilia bacterium]
MKLRWFGQSAFLLSGARRVAIDPFGPMEGLASRGIVFDYPPIEGVEADLLLITHEHRDHDFAEAVDAPQTIRALAGTFESPVGTVVGVASEHDEVAGTRRGHNVIFRFDLDGLGVCHLGDLGQPALRPEQRAAIGAVDVLLVPVGGGPTIGGEAAAAVVRDLGPRLVVPMHYGNAAVSFLGPPDEFLAALGAGVDRPGVAEAELEDHLGTPRAPRVLLLEPPAGRRPGRPQAPSIASR